jgi:hypothetical protein
MADENNEEVVQKNQVVELTPVQQEARESGWVPKEEYTGDPDKWVDAAEFIRRGELFKKIETQSRAIKDLNKAIQDIQALHAKSREVEYKRALETVRREKKQALEDGDADAVIEADEKIEMLRDAQRNDPPPREEQHTGEEHPEFVNWKAKNTWYETNKGMKAYADTVGAELRASGLSPSEVLKAVERKVREEFPQRFKNPNQEKPNAVEGGSTRSGKGGGDSYVLDDTERSIMNNFIRLGVMTKEQYIAELKKVKGE